MRHHSRLLIRDDTLNCGSGGGDHSDTSLRVASIFVILVGSLFGALFPVVAKRTKWLSKRMPQQAFDTAKYFGSGVIIATSLFHLLAPAIDELGSPCLSPAWQDFPYAIAICMVSIFLIFVVELVAFRWGTARLARLGLAHDAHGHGLGPHASHGPETSHITQANVARDDTRPESEETLQLQQEKSRDVESANSHEHAHAHAHDGPRFPHAHSDVEARGHKHHHPHAVGDSPVAQIVGIAILEFGVLLHSILIGLTLAVNDEFKVLFIVIVFHQTFEGLGVGARLAFVRLPAKYNYIPVLGAILFGITTPIGIAAGLGVRETYNPGSTTASIVSGVLDAFSSGILLYTGLVELMAHEFLFNLDMLNGSNLKLAYAVGCMMLGAGLMALLGRWA